MSLETKDRIIRVYLACREQFGVDLKDEISGRRESVQARQAAWHLIKGHSKTKRLSTLSLMGRVIAEFIGREKEYDHATVIHSLSSVERYLEAPDIISKKFQDNYRAIESRMDNIVADPPLTLEQIFAKRLADVSDNTLISWAELEVSNLANGSSVTMSSPPSVTDTDKVLNELIRRFRKLTTPG